jgi:D-sedoheptulose 7-phosphate isomerase
MPSDGASEYTRRFLEESVRALEALDARSIDAVADGLADVRDGGGRLFVLGVGGRQRTRATP